MKLFDKLFFLVLIFLCSCQSNWSYHQELDKVTKKYIRKIEKKYGLHCRATGGSMPYDLVYVSIDFIAPKPVSIDEARILEINCARTLAKMLNESNQLHPYFREYPYPLSRAKIMISFVDEDTQKDDQNRVDLVFIAKGKVFYERNDKKTNKYQTIHVETVEEAVKSIQSRKFT